MSVPAGKNSLLHWMWLRSQAALSSPSEDREMLNQNPVPSLGFGSEVVALPAVSQSIFHPILTGSEPPMVTSFKNVSGMRSKLRRNKRRFRA